MSTGSESQEKFPTPLDLEWAERLHEYRPLELEKVRENAAKWQTSLATLSGILMTGLALSAPFLAGTIEQLSLKITLIIGISSALTLLAIAGWQATVAAAGTPTTAATSEGYRQAVRLKIVESTAALKRARVFYLVGQAALVVTIAIAMLLVPLRSNVSSDALVIISGGRQLCGLLKPGGEPRAIRIETSSGNVEEVPLRDVLSIQSVEAC